MTTRHLLHMVAICSTLALAGRANAQPTVQALITCFSAEAQRTASDLMVVVEPIVNTATGAQYQRGLPQAEFTQYVAGVLRQMGFRPVVTQTLAELGDLKLNHKPDLIVRGGLIGFDALTSRYREATDFGLGLGGGRGSTSANRSAESTISIGAVEATINAETHQTFRGGKSGMFAVTATARARAEFILRQKNEQLSGSILIGFGGGTARESMTVVDVQAAAKSAIATATVLAIADHLKLSTPPCI